MNAPPPQTITVVNDAGIPRGQIRRVERAVAQQVRIAGRWWNLPTVRFEDFVLPRWFSWSRAGRLDYLRRLRGWLPFLLQMTRDTGGTAMRTTDPAIEPADE